MIFNGAGVKVEEATFCAVMDTLVDQDDTKAKVANFCAVI